MKLVSLLFMLSLVGCPNGAVTASPTPFPVPDTGQCEAMCLHLQALGCEEGKPLYDSDLPGAPGVPNETCTEDCEKQQNNGVFYNPSCVKKAASCSDIESARKNRCFD